MPPLALVIEDDPKLSTIYDTVVKQIVKSFGVSRLRELVAQLFADTTSTIASV